MSGRHLQIDVPEAGAITAIEYPAGESPAAPRTLVLAHGAGAGQQHPFMVAAARALSERGLRVVTFNFPYVEQRRRAPDRPAVLERTWAAVIEAATAGPLASVGSLVIGGKSMGGRIASQVLASDVAHPVDGLVLLGYPLHPPGKPLQLRTEHLPRIRTPMLVVQGERDPFGTEGEIRPVFQELDVPVTIEIVPGGDHSFKVPKQHDRTQTMVLDDIWARIDLWTRNLPRSTPPPPRP
jgi:uncharacterized protein